MIGICFLDVEGNANWFLIATLNTLFSFKICCHGDFWPAVSESVTSKESGNTLLGAGRGNGEGSP